MLKYDNMVFHVLVYLTIGLIASVFGLSVYLKDRKNIIYKTFGLLNAVLAVWALGCAIWLFQTEKEAALFWTRIFCLAATLIPVFLLHWILAFLKKDEEKRKILKACYFITVIFILFSFSSLYIKEVKPLLNFSYWPQAGPMYISYLIFGYFGMWFYGLYQLLLAHKENTGHRQMQIRYVILGSILGMGGGATNFLLMLGISAFPPLNFLIIAYPLIFSYAMMKHALMDIRVVLTEFLVFLVGAVLFVEALTAESLKLVIYKSGILIIFGFFGYLLIKSVLNEIKRREELERLTLELKEAYKKLEILDEAKSEFISIASHQLRTPLSAIKGYISMILEGTYGDLPPKTKKPIENVYESNERLIRLVNDFLSISRIESGKMEMILEKTSLDDIISSVVDELKIKAEEKQLKLIWEKPKESLSQILLDVAKIRQVILNLVDNAIKYTNYGQVAITTKLRFPSILIQIKDTGEGMTEEEISHLFESFSRGKAGTKHWTEGAGLGLYIAKKFVEMHGGRMWAESPGKEKGSTFYIELPIERRTALPNIV